MRVLHTSDWHLGRAFGPVSLQPYQAAFIDWLVEVVAAEQIDLVVVAGDLFDRALPPAWAVDLMRDALLRLRGAGAHLALIAGNHDGPERVAAYDVFVEQAGIYIRGGYRGAGEVVTLPFADGPLDLVLLPYLEPALEPAAGEPAPPPTPPAPAVAGEAGEAGEAGDARRRRTHHDVLAAAASRAAAALRSPRSLAVAHAFVVGGQGVAVSDSERQLTVGGTAEVGVEVFAPFSYTALGHLHTPQQVGAPHVRYSGTPLAYSFSETVAKQVVVVDLAADGTAGVTDIAVPVGRGVVTLRGTMSELLALPQPDAVQRWVRAELLDPTPVVDAKVRLADVYPHIVEVDWRPPARTEGADAVPVDHRRRLSPGEAVHQYWADLHGVEPTPAESAALVLGIEKAAGA
jgi:exonuclease SbcD